jgi:hypothetical protein
MTRRGEDRRYAPVRGNVPRARIRPPGSPPLAKAPCLVEHHAEVLERQLEIDRRMDSKEWNANNGPTCGVGCDGVALSPW